MGAVHPRTLLHTAIVGSSTAPYPPRRLREILDGSTRWLVSTPVTNAQALPLPLSCKVLELMTPLPFRVGRSSNTLGSYEACLSLIVPATTGPPEQIDCDCQK